MTEPAVGASTCASGSQVWRGNSGTLDGEGDEEGQKEQHLLEGGEGEAAARELIQDRRVAERAGAIVQINDGRQHQHRTGHGVEKEFHCGVNAPVMAPDTD